MGTIWLIFSTARATWSPIADGSLAKLYPNALAVLVLSWILCILCVSMVGFALPAFRKRFHNQFECIHRFVGWMTLFIFWVHFILSTDIERGILMVLPPQSARRDRGPVHPCCPSAL